MGNTESPFKHLKAYLCLSWKFCAMQTVNKAQLTPTILSVNKNSVGREVEVCESRLDYGAVRQHSLTWLWITRRVSTASTPRQRLSVSALLSYSDTISRPSLQDERRASAVPSSLPRGTLGPRQLSRSVLFYLWDHFLCTTVLHKFYSERHKTRSHRGQRLACAITK